MIRGRTYRVGRGERVDLAEATANSGITVHRIQNVGNYRIWVGGKVGNGLRLEPGKTLDGLSAGSADKLRVAAEIPDDAPDDAFAEVDALVTFESIFTGDDEDED